MNHRTIVICYIEVKQPIISLINIIFVKKKAKNYNKIYSK